MTNKWKDIWNNRSVDKDKLTTENEFDLYRELKKLDGFDVQVEDEIPYYKCLYDNIISIFEERFSGVGSVFEVGCGSGANLVLFRNRGKKVGGMDYSDNLSAVAKQMVGKETIEIGEAAQLDFTDKYDVVISDSVFAYFYDNKYASRVLERMYKKSLSQIVLLEIFDKSKEKECINYRRSLVQDYDKRYEGLDKLFFKKRFFADFAQSHNCDIQFQNVKNEFYWNSKYLFNCFMQKRKGHL